MTDIVPPHPSAFPDDVLRLAAQAIDIPDHGYPIRVLDPFAGVGGVHKLHEWLPYVDTTGIELMPRWAAAHERTYVGDATALPANWSGMFDAVVTSPCYGNRMADHHEASDKCSTCGGDGIIGYVLGKPDRCPKCKGKKLSHRRSYRHYYGPDFLTSVPLEKNAGAMAWGDNYRQLHRAAWAEVHRVLRPGGRFTLNIKDHIRDGKRVRVPRWHHQTALALGFVDLWRWDIPLDGYGYGANRAARVPTEQLYVMQKS